jgi:hypothetical protein
MNHTISDNVKLFNQIQKLVSEIISKDRRNLSKLAVKYGAPVEEVAKAIGVSTVWVYRKYLNEEVK